MKVASTAALVRDALDDALEADRLVAGKTGIRHVPQIDLPLVRAVLRERRAGRHVLRFAGRRDLREDVGDRFEVGHRIDLRPVLAPPGQPRPWRLGVAVGRPLRIDEIELEFERNDRCPAARGVALEHAAEHVAWIAEERLSGGILHLHLQLRDARDRARAR